MIHTFDFGWRSDGSASVLSSVAKTGTKETNFNESVNTGVSNQRVNVTVPTTYKGFFLISTVAITVVFYDASNAIIATCAVGPNSPLIQLASDAHGDLFVATAVAYFKVSNASGSTANITGRVLA